MVASGNAQSEKSIKKYVVATREVPPFAMKGEHGEWIGITIDLLREVKSELQNASEQEIQFEFREMKLEAMLDAVAQGKVDLAAAAITVNYDREKRMDFTHPFHSSGLGIAVRAHPRNSEWSRLMAAVFSTMFLRILAGLFAVMLLSAIAVYFFERKRNKEQFGGGLIRGITSGLWWAAVTLTTVGYGDKVPKTIPGRLIGFVWMFVGLFIIASFTAAVTSALTVTQLKSRVIGPADLSRVKVATVQSSTSEKYLRSRQIVFKKYPDVRVALEALKKGQVEAIVYDAPIMRYETNRHFEGEIQVLPVLFERQNYAIALPNDSPLREPINQVILRLSGSPEWKSVLADYLGEGFEQ
tara:strand:- start:24646 stop:25710 length:1065 start_codon:yes stop_codon:yes gene_type:complete